MKINKRLIKLSNYIDNFSNVIDVGCDHALLCIYLVKNKKSVRCIASDINEGPLKQALKNIESYELGDFIKVKIGDGITTIEDFVDTIVISGMGGRNIVDILSYSSDKLVNIKKIVLSPNSDFPLVREEVSKLGFKIICEEIVLDNKKYYPIIVFEKGSQTYSDDEILFGYNVLVNEDLKSYYAYLISNYNNRLYNIPNRYKGVKNNIKKMIDILEKKNR